MTMSSSLVTASTPAYLYASAQRGSLPKAQPLLHGQRVDLDHPAVHLVRQQVTPFAKGVDVGGQIVEIRIVKYGHVWTDGNPHAAHQVQPCAMAPWDLFALDNRCLVDPHFEWAGGEIVVSSWRKLPEAKLRGLAYDFTPCTNWASLKRVKSCFSTYTSPRATRRAGAGPLLRCGDLQRQRTRTVRRLAVTFSP